MLKLFIVDLFCLKSPVMLAFGDDTPSTSTKKPLYQTRRTTVQGQKGRGRGFASMSADKKREIASKGGKAAHALGTAHKWSSEEAQAAGRKGGSISRRRPKNTIQA